MKTSKEKPPIYERCHKQFGVNWKEGVIFTYGDTIHCKYKIPKQKIAHEKVHIRQQLAYGVEEWWNRYFTDEDFRLEQEIEAYKEEIKWIRKNIKGLFDMRKRIGKIVKDLSSSMYGNITTKEEVIKLLGDDRRVE